jgi:hypothetical protein
VGRLADLSGKAADALGGLGDMPCPHPASTVIVRNGKDPPADGPPNPNCGKLHVLHITEVVVEPGNTNEPGIFGR